MNTNNKKVLILIRHAKSSWEYDVSDVKRPLKKRGVSDANLVSNHLKGVVLTPDIMLCSPSKRTQETAKIFIENWGFNKVEMKLVNDLYDFSGSDALKVIQSCDDNIQCLMVFGHNNALTTIANNLGNEYIDNLTTSGYVELHFETSSWTNLSLGETKKIVFPKHLK
jgi:phosphohistidine phosphatase